MADELKDQRVVTMMSSSELTAIDDWMFKNRIRSRGEAIRRLCQIALETDGQIEVLDTKINAAQMAGQDLGNLFLAGITGEFQIEFEDAYERTISVQEKMNDIQIAAMRIASPILKLKSTEDLEQAMRDAETEKVRIAKMREEFALVLPGDHPNKSAVRRMREEALVALQLGDAERLIQSGFLLELSAAHRRKSLAALDEGNFAAAAAAIDLEQMDLADEDDAASTLRAALQAIINGTP